MKVTEYGSCRLVFSREKAFNEFELLIAMAKEGFVFIDQSVNFMKDEIVFFAVSEHLPPVHLGQMAPEATVQFTENEEGELRVALICGNDVLYSFKPD